MTSTLDPREELLSLAATYRHLRSEHTRAAPEGSRRRRIESDMSDVAARIERRLTGLDLTDEERGAWRNHVHHAAPPPDVPAAAVAPTPAAQPQDRPIGRRPWPR